MNSAKEIRRLYQYIDKLENTGWIVLELDKNVEKAAAEAASTERIYKEVHRLYDDDEHWAYTSSKGLGEYLAAIAVKVREDAIPYEQIEDTILEYPSWKEYVPNGYYIFTVSEKGWETRYKSASKTRLDEAIKAWNDGDKKFQEVIKDFPEIEPY